MQGLTERQQRILSELEEFREQDIVPLMNVAFDRLGTQAELAAFGSSIRDLLTKDVIQVSIQTLYPGSDRLLDAVEANALLENLSKWIEFGKYGKYWHYVDLNSVPHQRPNIIPTALGLRMSETILGERGYQWWRSKPS